jgi:3-hydroxyisobutyrate dehydrogenase
VSKSSVGFIGLGAMGLPMAGCVQRAGLPTTVWDVDPRRTELAAQQASAAAAKSAQDLASSCDFVVTMLPTPQSVRDATLGGDGFLRAMRPGATYLDLSTIDPMTIQQIASAAKASGIKVIDGAVSGTPEKEAREGTLSIMLGGDRDAIEEADPVLSALSRVTYHMGGVGTAKLAKLCNNLLCAITTAATAEIFQIADQSGMDMQLFYDVVSASSGDSWSLRRKFPFSGVVADAPANVGYQGGFRLDLMCKDLRLALAVAQENRAPAMLGSLAYQLYQSAARHDPARDFSAVATIFSQMTDAPGDGPSAPAHPQVPA